MSKVLAFNREQRRYSPRNDADSRDPAEKPIARPARSERHERHGAKVTQLFPRGDGSTTAAVQIVATIVVPTKGRPQMLNRCIASLVLQRFDPRRYEIVIVDDGPDEGTQDVVTGWAEHTAGSGPAITYLPSPGPHGPAAARNFGWRAARGEIIAFTDDDTIARADWLQHGVDAFHDGVDAVWGRIVMPLNGTPTDYELDAKNLEAAEFVTANCFVRKRTMEATGGFDERFRFAWREDSDLYFNLLAGKARIVHAADAVMTHPIRPAHWGVSLSQVKKVQFDALLFKKHPAMYREKIRRRARWDFYATVAALLLAIAGALSESAEIGVPAALVWLLLTGRFCLARLRRTSKRPSHVAEMIVTSALIPPLAVFWRAVGSYKFKVALL
ncbi:glycosyltransferase family 2 protein [Noviherbaspirillum galbum]|uniref:Glycosyltransferase n=1 Tax=Noviherbaspirillum galbum TaxID=2709383 RepID=A0A6B3SI51_9BURK|nr:glycosyltransferase [Noviherbaspirillum galbum]NEX60363.1 glycosyltransferase [Noviherbaspirillum galbum]